MSSPTGGHAPQGRSLRDVTAEWFLFLTAFRRSVRAMPQDPQWTRRRLLELLAKMDRDAAGDRNLDLKLREARYPLVYFADEVLLSCGWAAEQQWAGDLLETHVFQTSHAGRDFFRRANDPALQDPDVLEVYFRCLCLGFRGEFVRKPLQLREEREKVARRIALPRLASSRFCPEAYAHTDDRNFVKFPAVATARVAILLGAAVMALYAIAAIVSSESLSELNATALRVGGGG